MTEKPDRPSRPGFPSARPKRDLECTVVLVLDDDNFPQYMLDFGTPTRMPANQIMAGFVGKRVRITIEELGTG